MGKVGEVIESSGVGSGASTVGSDMFSGTLESSWNGQPRVVWWRPLTR